MQYANLLLPTLIGSALVAQPAPQDAARPRPDQAITCAWHVPFHTDADGTAWAAGHDYKFAVGDDVTFYPRVAAHDHLPLRWRTRRVAVGHTDVVAAASAVARTRSVHGFHLELDHGGAVEIYDARPEGVEQSFRVQRPGRVDGDLVIVGDISGPLRAETRAHAHQELRFRGREDHEYVRYGAATAIDAGGDRLPITTAYADGQIELRVPAAWLTRAAWPITIDPLLAPQVLPGSPAGAAERTQVVRAHAQSRLFVAESRPGSGSDWDIIVRAYDDDWTPRGVVFSELSTVSCRRSSLAYSASEDRIVVAIGCESATLDRVRLYLHTAASLLLNSGAMLEVPRPAGTHDTDPSLGGSSNRYCYLAFRRDVSIIPSNTAQSRVLGVRVDARSLALAAAQTLHAIGGSDYDAERPSVSEFSEAGGWLVVWQEYENAVAGDDWDVVGERIDANGVSAGGRRLAQSTQTWLHKLTPQVAGSGSRFALTWVARSNDGSKTSTQTGNGVYVQRVTWPSTGVADPGVVHQVDVSAATDLLLGTGTRRMSFDYTTDSHWAVTWDRLGLGELRIARLGYDARLAETAVLAAQLPAGSYAWPSLCFDQQAHAFVATYASSGVGFPVYGRRFCHGAAAASPYGAGCAGSIATFNASAGGVPYAGSEYFGIRLDHGRANAPTILLGGLAPGLLPLPYGAAGCSLLLDPTLPLLVLPTPPTDASGDVQIGLPIRSGLRGDSYWQFVQLDGDRLWSSNGLLTRIR